MILGLSAENDERRDPITGVDELLSNMIDILRKKAFFADFPCSAL